LSEPTGGGDAVREPHRRRTAARVYRIASMAILCGTALLPFIADVEHSGGPILLLSVVAISAFLPPGAALSTVSLALIANTAARRLNQAKIDLTQSPLTTFDLKAAWNDPQGLWLSLNWSPWSTWLVAAACISITGIIFVVAAIATRRVRDSWAGFGRIRSIALLTAILLSAHNVSLLTTALLGKIRGDSTLWEPQGLATHAKTVGAIPFLLLSQSLERRVTGLFYAEDVASTVTSADIDDAVSRYLSPRVAPPAELPNVVVLFAESTFDPNTAFRLNRPVANSLFERHDDTALLAPLHVNAVGGGSWIEEFESLVGIDSRFFGYAGYYTHSMLAPFTKRSFVTDLAGRGYDTVAYYPWEGTFYNARQAYAHYGFGRFLDSNDLGRIDMRRSDVVIASLSIQHTRQAIRAPFFSYVVLAENHSPHACGNATVAFSTTFATVGNIAMNCELNEYLRRLEATSIAFEQWHAYLQEIQRSTGRPYVLLVFGDHQPHTFTSTGTWNYDYSPARSSRSMRETFVHIRSNLRSIVRCCNVPPPVTLLPTLLSAFIAADNTEIYLPENLIVYRDCGSDPLGGEISSGVYDAVDSSGGLRHVKCGALDGALVRYRQEGIF
jgi:hypothetical protein